MYEYSLSLSTTILYRRVRKEIIHIYRHHGYLHQLHVPYMRDRSNVGDEVIIVESVNDKSGNEYRGSTE
jgi:hypothetical protein